VSDPLQIPSFPPEGPWELYVLVLIWLPFLFRALLLTRPLYRVIKKFAPHGGWAIRQLRELPIKGLSILVLNESLAFMLPPLTVILFRIQFDPIGWGTWDEAGFIGFLILLTFFLLWIVFDAFRIFRVRRMLISIDRYDVDKLKKIADVGIKTRRFFRRFSKKETEEGDETSALDAASRVGKRSAKFWGLRALKMRKLSPAGLLSSVAVGAAIEAARAGAGKVSDIIDEKMQEEFDKIAKVNTKTLLGLLIRDFAMGILPLFVLAILPVLL
jgi:hypothetical protein